MAETIVLPQQGNSVEEVVLLEWKVRIGDSISEGDVVCEVETDKATMEVEASAGGTVLALLAEAGDEVPVKTPIVIVGEPGEDISGLDTGNTDADASASGPAEPARPTTAASTAAAAATPPAATPNGDNAASGASASPRARMRAAERGVNPATLTGTGPGGRVIERDVLSAAAPATAAARAQGLQGRQEGTALGGRIASADPSAATPTSAAPPSTPAEAPASGPAEVARELPVSGIRKVVAERMLASLQDTAQLTLHSSADARALQQMRRRFKAEGESLGLSGITLNDMVMYAVVRTLPDFPELNAHFHGTKISVFSGVDLSFAVDTPRGLLVPTVQGAGGLSLAELSARIKELASRAIDGKAGPADLAMGTFTVTNLGAFGIERFTPVLNPPQVAILGVGSIDLKPVAAADGTGVEHLPHIGLSLTIDHQAVDGAPGARFLAALSGAIAGFDLLLAR